MPNIRIPLCALLWKKASLFPGVAQVNVGFYIHDCSTRKGVKSGRMLVMIMI